MSPLQLQRFMKVCVVRRLLGLTEKESVLTNTPCGVAASIKQVIFVCTGLLRRTLLRLMNIKVGLWIPGLLAALRNDLDSKSPENGLWGSLDLNPFVCVQPSVLRTVLGAACRVNGCMHEWAKKL